MVTKQQANRAAFITQHGALKRKLGAEIEDMSLREKRALRTLMRYATSPRRVCNLANLA